MIVGGFIGQLSSDVDHVWEEVSFVELETEHLPLLDLLPPLLRSDDDGLLGELCCFNARGHNDQAALSQPVPQWMTPLWPGLGSCLCDT